MADENISIQIDDKVNANIVVKIRAIATESRSANDEVSKLQKALSSLNAGGLNSLSTSVSAAQRAMQQAALAAQNLANAQLSGAAAAANAAAAQQRVITAAVNTATATNNLAAAQQKVATAQTQGVTAAANLATAVVKTTTAQIGGVTAAQRLATEQQRTATASANAAAAADRASLAALRLSQAQDKAGASSRAAGDGLLGFVRGAAAAVGVGLSAHAIIESADAYTTLQNKLQNVAKSQEQVNELTGRLFDIANNTRSSVEATSTAFTRFDRSLMQMGKSQEDTLRLTETINKALINSGATATESASALLQLSQAFNAGKLQGDEFRAVSENMPIVLDAVAKVLGVGINQVKKYGTEGKITAEVLTRAFKAIESQVDATFAKTTPTIAQALQVLSNKANQFFGELNKATGFSNALAQAILFLGNNMKIVAVIVAGLGVALLAAFGPVLIGALGAILSPLILIVGAIGAAAAAIAIFGDDVKVTADGAVTFKDLFRTAFEYIKDAAGAVAGFFKDVWNGAFGDVQTFTSDFVGGMLQALQLIGNTVKTVTNFLIGSFVAGYQAITGIWNNFGPIMGAFFASVVNLGASAVETVVNAWQQGLRLIARAAESVAPDVSKTINSVLDTVTLKLPRMDVSQAGVDAAKDLGKTIKNSITRDYIGDAAGAFMDKARTVAAARAKADENKPGGSTLRGAGKNQLTPDDDGKAAKAAEKRAKAMEGVNLKLDNEIQRMGLLKPLREQQEKFDQIEQSLQQKGIKLTDSETQSIKGKIAAIQQATYVQAEFDRIYEEATGPLRTYNAVVEANQKLLTMGAISQAEFNKQNVKAIETYANLADPMRQTNKDLQQQLELVTMLPKQREIEQQVMQVINYKLSQGNVLSTTELALLRDKLATLQQLNAVSQQESSILDATVGKREQYVNQLKAIQNLKANSKSGFGAGDAATATNDLLKNMGLDTTNLQVGMTAQVAAYDTMYKQIAQMRAADLINSQEASNLELQIWNKQQNDRLSKSQSFFTGLAALQGSSNKKLAAIGKAAAITNAVIDTYKSATGAYAAMSAIPYVGPALGAAAAAAAIAAGMANVAQIKAQNSTGFAKGGYTGDMPTNQVAGPVHGKEFVFDAPATARIGADNLEAMRQGKASAGSAGGSPTVAAASPNVNVTPNIINVLDPSLVSQYLNTPDGQKAIINVVQTNPSAFRSALG